MIVIRFLNVQNKRVIIKNVLRILDFSFRCNSVNQKYKRFKRQGAHYEILWHRVTLRNECSAFEYLIQR